MPATFPLSKPSHEKSPGQLGDGFGRANVNRVHRLPEANRGQPMVLPCAAEEWRTRFRSQEDSAVLPKLRLPIFRIFRNRFFTNLEIETTTHY